MAGLLLIRVKQISAIKIPLTGGFLLNHVVFQSSENLSQIVLLNNEIKKSIIIMSKCMFQELYKAHSIELPQKHKNLNTANQFNLYGNPMVFTILPCRVILPKIFSVDLKIPFKLDNIFILHPY